MSTTEQAKFSVREQLDRVSPSFCLAKWLQVTLHLHSGHNHSCHHPKTHKTPLKELKSSPSALHNTCFKKDQRRQMLEGTRPAECGYCWNIEDLGPSFLSDRTLKSSEFWALDSLEKIAALPANADINPTYVEVSFSNVCNFRCSYCSGNFSSRWKEEVAKGGAYATRAGEQTMDILPEEGNPYIAAFWKWWPDLVKDLKVFRITGGEPLLSKNTFLVLENLVQNPRPNLEFAINSNLGVSDATFEKFLILAKDLVQNQKVKSLTLYTSVESWGEKAEYIRNGLSYPKFQKNIETFLEQVPKAQVIIMSTFNSLCVTSFKELLVYVKSLKVKFKGASGTCPIFIDISYLRHPTYQSIQVLPEYFQSYVEDIASYMKENQSTSENAAGFHFHEYIKIQRTLEWMKQPVPSDELKMHRQNFKNFFSEHDRRRGTNFLTTFPEMKEFWESCPE